MIYIIHIKLYPESCILQIIKIPGTVHFQFSEHTLFGADTDIEKTKLPYRRNIDSHLPAMHFP